MEAVAGPGIPPCPGGGRPDTHFDAVEQEQDSAGYLKCPQRYAHLNQQQLARGDEEEQDPERVEDGQNGRFGPLHRCQLGRYDQKDREHPDRIEHDEQGDEIVDQPLRNRIPRGIQGAQAPTRPWLFSPNDVRMTD